MKWYHASISPDEAQRYREAARTVGIRIEIRDSLRPGRRDVFVECSDGWKMDAFTLATER